MHKDPINKHTILPQPLYFQRELQQHVLAYADQHSIKVQVLKSLINASTLSSICTATFPDQTLKAYFYYDHLYIYHTFPLGTTDHNISPTKHAFTLYDPTAATKALHEALLLWSI
jgi:hypothetical protein